MRVGLTFGYCESRTPLVTKDVQTDAAVGVDVRVVDSGGEVHFWRLEWVVGREVYGEKEYATRVWGVTLARTLEKHTDEPDQASVKVSPVHELEEHLQDPLSLPASETVEKRRQQA